jgi:hypothetical protein
MAIEVGKTYRTGKGDIVTITDKPSGLASFPFLGDNGRSYTADGKYLENSTHEEDLVEEFTSFRTQQEVWGYLAGGGYLTYEDKLIGFHEGSLSLFSIYGELLEIDLSWGFDFPEIWTIGFVQTKPEPKWYYNIPEQGILCWVKDEEEGLAKLTIIIAYGTDSTFKFEGLEDYWEYATPVTLEEIANYIYECE